jgi:hypothetical protein
MIRIGAVKRKEKEETFGPQFDKINLAIGSGTCAETVR